MLKRKFQKYVKSISKALPGSLRGVLIMSRVCFTYVLKVFPWCFREPSWVFLECFNEVSRVVHEFFTNVPMKFVL